MKIKGIYNELHPGITMHKIPVKAGFPGALFTIGMLGVFLMGIPPLTWFLVFAIVVGIGVAVMLRFIPRLAELVVLLLTGVMIVCLAFVPSLDWQLEKIDKRLLEAAIVAPPPPPDDVDFIAPFKCDCREPKRKQPCDSKSKRHPIKNSRKDVASQHLSAQANWLKLLER